MNKEFFRGIWTGAMGMLSIVLVLITIYTVATGEQPFHLLFENEISTNLPTTSGGAITFQQKNQQVEASTVVSKLYLLEQYVDKYFMLDRSETDEVSGIYKGFVESLGDQYSAYYSADEYNSLKISTEGNYSGVGAVVQMDKNNGTISIVGIYEDSPAMEAGIKEEDVLVSVDKKNVTGVDLSKVASWMKGEEGTKVELVVQRKGEKLTFEVERRKIELRSVGSKMLDNNIGYIRVISFEEATVGQFNEAVEKLVKDGMKGLIIDLRNNGGGVVESSISMLDRILPEGVVLSTKDKEGNTKVYHSTNQKTLDVPLVVLINQNSASASEIFAGAIKDREAGTLVGMNSYGKGIVQTVFGLGDGSALKITTSEYYTPSGQNIHGKGIAPDIEVELPEEVYEQGYTSEDSDTQLKKAVEVMGEKMRSETED